MLSEIKMHWLRLLLNQIISIKVKDTPVSLENMETSVLVTSNLFLLSAGTFSPTYRITIGADFAVKTIDWNNSTKVQLQLWDIAGHERFGYLTGVYYRYA